MTRQPRLITMQGKRPVLSGMNLVMLEGHGAKTLSGGKYDDLFWGMYDFADMDKLMPDARKFAELLVKSMSLYDDTKKQWAEMLDWKGLGYKDMDEFAEGIILCRMANKFYPGDWIFPSIDIDTQPFLYLRKFIGIKENGDLKALLLEMQNNLANNGYPWKLFRTALLCMDIAYNYYAGFYTVKTGLFANLNSVFDIFKDTSGETKGEHQRNQELFKFIMNQTTDSVSKELQSSLDKYVKDVRNEAESNSKWIAAGDAVQSVVDTVKDAVGVVGQEVSNMSFRASVPLLAASAIPLSVVAGIRPKNKGILAAGIAASAVPLYIAGNFAVRSDAETSTKLTWGVPAVILGGTAGFLIGKFLINPHVHGVAKRVASAKVGISL